MNQAASSLTDKKELRGAVQNEKLYRQKGAGTRELYQAETLVGYCKVTILQGLSGNLPNQC